MRRPTKKYEEEWLEDEKMSPAQKEVFIIVDESLFQQEHGAAHLPDSGLAGQA